MDIAAAHALLLQDIPEGATHDVESCPLCSSEEIIQKLEAERVDKTYSEDEVKALVTAAVAEKTDALQTELDEIRSGQKAEEVEARITDAKAEADAKVDEIQAKLDAAVLEAEQAKTERDEILAWLKEESETAEREAEISRLREERKAKVAEVASFPEDYVEERAEKWAQMEEEAFEAMLSDYAAITAKSSESTELPKTTAMQAAREPDGKKESAISELLNLRREGVDPRQLVA